MGIDSIPWNPEFDIIDTTCSPLLPIDDVYVQQFRNWDYVINTAKGLYRKSRTNDDLILFDGKTEQTILCDVEYYPQHIYHDFLILYLRKTDSYYLIDSKGILFDLTGCISVNRKQRYFKITVDLQKGYYLVGETAILFRTQTQQIEYEEKTKADLGALFNKEFNRFIRNNAHNSGKYLYLTGGQSKCGRFLEHFIEQGMEYELIPNMLIDDETINIRIPLFGSNIGRQDVQYLTAKYKNTYSILNIPIEEICGGMNLSWETAEKYNAYFYLPKEKQIIIYSIINTLHHIFQTDDNHSVFIRSAAKIFRQFQKGDSSVFGNMFLDLLLLYPEDRKIDAEYLFKHREYIRSLLGYDDASKLLDDSSSFFYGYNRNLYKRAYDAAIQHFNQAIKSYENQVNRKIVAKGKKISKWSNEGNLFTLVVKQYPDAVYQYHAKWLGHQSLDIFIPSLRVGIEYQGLQHYEPVAFFGGADGFLRTQERDRRKAELCRLNDVRLIYWRYDETISLSRLKTKL